MVFAAVPALLLVPRFTDAPRTGARRKREPSRATSTWLDVEGVLRIPTLLWIIASGALLNFSMYAIGTFLPAFSEPSPRPVAGGKSGIATGVVYLAGGVSGGNCCGLSGRFHQSSVAKTAACFAPPSWLWWPFRLRAWEFFSPRALVSGDGVPGADVLRLTTYYGLVYSAIQDIVAPNQRGAAMAIYFMAMNMCGASFGPLLTGKLSDVFGASRRGSGGFSHGHGNFPRHWPSASHADYSSSLHSARVCALHGLAHYHHGYSAAGRYRWRRVVD